VVALGDRYYSAFGWLPGQPLVRYGDFRTPGGETVDVPLPASAPAPEVVQDAARAIGRLHAATVDLAADKGSKHPLMSHLGQAERTWENQRRRVGRSAADFPEIRRWLRCGHRVVATAGDLVRQAGETGNRLSVVHGDLWPANLLVKGAGDARHLTGVAGWSSVKVDTPLIDLAHLVTHTSGWSGARAEDVLAAYTDAAPISPVERRLLPVVAAIDLLPTVGDVLILAFVDEEMATHEAQPVLRSGLKSLLSSLENLTQILAPDDEWAQRQTNANRQERRSSSPRTPRGTRTKQARRPGSGQSRQR
jgi:Ser/Thr protein kinase RdoA (MazF antagonist)